MTIGDNACVSSLRFLSYLFILNFICNLSDSLGSSTCKGLGPIAFCKRAEEPKSLPTTDTVLICRQTTKSISSGPGRFFKICNNSTMKFFWYKNTSDMKEKWSKDPDWGTCFFPWHLKQAWKRTIFLWTHSDLRSGMPPLNLGRWDQI